MASATIVRLQVPDRDEAQRASHREAHPLCQRFGAARGYLLPHEERELNERLASAGSDIEVEISRSGATLYATSEKALRRAAARITGERWQHLRAGPHEARVLSDPAREAWMNVTVRCERGFAAAVRCELEARGAHVGSASFSRSTPCSRPSRRSRDSSHSKTGSREPPGAPGTRRRYLRNGASSRPTTAAARRVAARGNSAGLP